MDSTKYHVGTDPQLFVDSEIIECTQGLTRRWHKPQRHGDVPLLAKDQPWEDTPYFTYSNYTVLRDPLDGRIKCWYEDLGPVDGRVPVDNSLLYAESEDGLNFRKPELDVCSYQGRRTNIVMGFAKGQPATAANPWAEVGAHSNSVIIDPHPPSREHRFRTIFSRASRDRSGQLSHVITCAHSADGIHWQAYDEAPRLGSSGCELSDVSVLHYDHDARLFVQNTRHGLMYDAALPASTPQVSGWFGPYYPQRPDLMNKRRVFQTHSHDFLHWSDLIPLASPDDALDNLDEAHYGMGQFKVGRMHFGLLGVLRYVDNGMEVRLLHSRDGIRFLPCDRGSPFLGPRGHGHWDAHMVSATSAPITVGDEWWFYHGGCSCHHDWWLCHPEALDEAEHRDPQAHVHFGLGLAKLRIEGIASLDASRQRDGYIITRALMSPGKRLLINARCRQGGSIRAEVLDLQNRPVDGCSLAASQPFVGDSTAQTMGWGTDTVAGGAGQWRKLHFLIRDSELFSFRFADDETVATQ